MISTHSGNETNIKLPFSFIFTSIIALIGSQILFLLQGDFIVNSLFRVPGVWSAAHLFILGWALMVAMGAMYQLVPVAFLTPIWSEKFGFLQYAVYTIGVFSFACFLFYHPQNSLIPGIITMIGIIMFLFQMLMTLKNQAKPNIITLYAGTALFCLLATIILGVLMLISLKTGFGSGFHSAIFKSHLLLGLAGWFTMLIFGFSYKMVPMFSLAHGYSMKLAHAVYPFYVMGLCLAIISFFTNSNLLLSTALFLLFIGYFLFTIHMFIILKKRVKKKLDYSFMFALFAIICGALIHFTSWISSVLGFFQKTAGPLLYLYLFLWIAFSIIGYLYKIVPFLWWTAKYSKEIGRKNVPALKDMMNDQGAVPVFISLFMSIIGIIISIGLENKLLFSISQTIFIVACILFSLTIAKVLTK